MNHEAPRAGPGLLVSVRSAEEALQALDGGADLIDIKEPARGPLGRADDAVIRAVQETVGKRRPLSAALGEWIDASAKDVPDVDLTYVKWGLAGCQRRSDWRDGWEHWRRRPQHVLVAYADWQCAVAPSIHDVLALACHHPGSMLLVDTHCKDRGRGTGRPTMLDWLSVAEVESMCALARQAGVRIALAGSLGLEEISRLLPAQPDWFAVRGAACESGDRESSVSAERVRRLAKLCRSAVRP
ncbi:MAG: hypothetical protein FJ303_11500 [Planctomycetes bacterium]|nr:hypothetical protein [Planctomycetota bacterium]